MDNLQTIYEQMSRQRLEVASVQVDILTHYDPEGKEKRVQELYDVSHRSIIDEQSEESLERMDELIKKYEWELNLFRTNRLDTEESDDVQKKIRELEKLCNLYSL